MKYKLTTEEREERIQEIIDNSDEPIFCKRCGIMIDLDLDDYYVDRFSRFFCCYCCRRGLLHPDIMIEMLINQNKSKPQKKLKEFLK